MYVYRKEGAQHQALDSRGTVQFRSLSARRVREWIAENNAESQRMLDRHRPIIQREQRKQREAQ